MLTQYLSQMFDQLVRKMALGREILELKGFLFRTIERGTYDKMVKTAYIWRSVLEKKNFVI